MSNHCSSTACPYEFSHTTDWCGIDARSRVDGMSELPLFIHAVVDSAHRHEGDKECDRFTIHVSRQLLEQVAAMVSVSSYRRQEAQQEHAEEPR